MDKNSCLAINLITVSDLMINRLQKESFQLKEVLQKIKPGEKLNQCVILEILNASRAELFMLIEQIDSTIVRLSDDDGIIEELGLIRRELVDYQATYTALDNGFRPYLSCPALEKPERNY